MRTPNNLPIELLDGALRLHIDYHDITHGTALLFIGKDAGSNTMPGQDGVEVLEDGDYLVVYEKPETGTEVNTDKIVWGGVVKLAPFRGLESSMGIQEGWDPADWAEVFNQGYPADFVRLIPPQDS